MERGHFLTNTMDKPLWKLNFEFLHFLQTSFFLRRKHSFLSRIWQNRPMVLVQKWPFFQLVFFKQYRQENVFYHILERKNAILGYKNKKFKKSKNLHFSKGVNPWFWSQNGHFYNLIFVGNIGQKNVFYDIPERKNAFLGYENKKFKKS